MPLSPAELKDLEVACRQLPPSGVQLEEAEVSRSPILLMMSTVLSLNRRWYSHALPARRRFQEHVVSSIPSMTLAQFRELANKESANRSDWRSLARFLWRNNEGKKAQLLTELVDYFLDWKQSNAPGLSDVEALQRWSTAVVRDDFVGKIKGLGPRTHEQLLWYIEGQEAIKLDRHVVTFIREVVKHPVSEDDTLSALRDVAVRLGLSATSLDTRIWDYMQARR